MKLPSQNLTIYTSSQSRDSHGEPNRSERALFGHVTGFDSATLVTTRLVHRMRFAVLLALCTQILPPGRSVADEGDNVIPQDAVKCT